MFRYEDEELNKLRESQLANLNKSGYPKIGKIKIEELYLDKINPSLVKEDEVAELPLNISQEIYDMKNILVLKDGNIIYNNLSADFKNIKLMSLFDALEKNDTETIMLLKNRLSKLDDNKLRNLNKAHLNSFLLIRIPKNEIVSEALNLYVIGEKTDLAHLTLVISEENSEFTLVEQIDNLSPITVNYISEATVLENAKLNYIGIDRLSENTNAFIERFGYVNDNGSLIYALGQLNDGNVVSNNEVKLIGQNAYSESRNVLFTDKENTHAVTINMEHLAPHSVGYINNHGIVKDKGYLFVDGIGKIHQGMSKSNSQQQTSIITLSKDARVNANPYLLIDEYDVQAGHGAAVGKVDEEQLYYLMSRGLSKTESEKLIIFGFLSPIIEMLTSDKIKESFINTIAKKLSI